MILATVGTQLPFDRMLRALDCWAAKNPKSEIHAQTGRTRETYGHMTCKDFLSPAEYAQVMERAEIVVSHAGMGSILTAAELGKPIVILPRLAAFGEHRTDHQLDTAAEMASLANVTVVSSPDDLGPALDRIAGSRFVARTERISSKADDNMIGAVADFVNGVS